MNNIVISAVEYKDITCPRCGKTRKENPLFLIDDLCIPCMTKIATEFWKEENFNMTVEEFKKMMEEK